MEFGKKLRDLMRKHRYSQESVAQALGVAQATISNWAKGEGGPSLAQALRLARMLDVPLDYLADDTLDAPPSPDLTADERAVMKMVRKIGADEALARLMWPPTKPSKGMLGELYDRKDDEDPPGRSRKRG